MPPALDRALVGALIGLVVCGLVARVAFGWLLHDHVGYATFPAALIGLVVGPVVALRLRRR